MGFRNWASKVLGGRPQVDGDDGEGGAILREEYGVDTLAQPAGGSPIGAAGDTGLSEVEAASEAERPTDAPSDPAP
jgi:hypothetical protein